MRAPVNVSQAIERGVSGCGLDIDGSSLIRLCVKAETYALCGEESMSLTMQELVLDHLEKMVALIPVLRADIAAARQPERLAA